MFVELLSLLVEHDSPLDQAVKLAADSTGDEILTGQASELSEQLRRGGMGPAPAGFPPLLGWVMLSIAQQPRLISTLKRAAIQYRRRARVLAAWCHVYLPILLTLAIGGTVTLAYALSVIVSWTSVVWQLIETI